MGGQSPEVNSQRDRLECRILETCGTHEARLTARGWTRGAQLLHATCYMLLDAFCLLLAVHCLLLAPGFWLATCYLLLAAYSLLHTACCLLHAACSLLLPACYCLLTACCLPLSTSRLVRAIYHFLTSHALEDGTARTSRKKNPALRGAQEAR